jgi:hypothetical protein
MGKGNRDFLKWQEVIEKCLRRIEEKLKLEDA